MTRVDVWTVDTSAAPLSAHRLLTREERARAGSIRHPDRAREVGATRAALRAVLGAYAGAPPTSLELGETPEGKPTLPGASLRFNVSHAPGLSLVVVASDCEVGVDLEPDAPRRRAARIARRHFTASERAAIGGAAEPAFGRAFLAVWTGKEAATKAVGLGLRIPLRDVEVPLDEGPVAVAGSAGPWQLRRPALPRGYLGAVVCGGAWPPELRPRRFAWPAAVAAAPARRSPPPTLLARRTR